MSVLWILGEAKSGKSELGEEIFHRLPGRKFYIGTLPKTPENAEQIRKHAERRPPDWELIEVTDDLSVAARIVGNCAREQTAVLLDGFAVYVQERARHWANEHPELTREAEAPFVEAICREYALLVGRCGYLIVVDHLSADPPTAADYARDPARWRLRESITSCRNDAHHVIYHDRADMTHTDTAFVEKTVKLLTGCGAGPERLPVQPQGMG